MDYHSWEAVHGLANMAGRADTETPTTGHAKINLGYNARMRMDVRDLLPMGVPVILSNCKECFISFIY